MGETYWQHLRFAARFGGKMCAGGLAAVTHAVCPFWFTTTASGIHDELTAILAESRERAARSAAAAAESPRRSGAGA